MDNPVYYAMRDRLVLPIVDVRHRPSSSADRAGARHVAEKYVNEAAGRQQQVTPELVEALKRSRLGRGLMAASNGFLGGIETCMMKAGPDNLAPDVIRSIALLPRPFPP